MVSTPEPSHVLTAIDSALVQRVQPVNATRNGSTADLPAVGRPGSCGGTFHVMPADVRTPPLLYSPSLPTSNPVRNSNENNAHPNFRRFNRAICNQKRYSVADLMDQLLVDIYKMGHYRSIESESSNEQTNWSNQSDQFSFTSTSAKRLQRKSVEELVTAIELLKDQLTMCCDSLVKALKRRDVLIVRRDAKCNMITAMLHAYSMKRSEDTKMRFNVKPGPGDSDFEQWQSAMKMVARLPDGVPQEFRNTLWLTLAEKYLASRDVEWPKVERFCFNDTTNPDDEELGVQIVKDLHRTGCSLFCGSSGLENQGLLKKVLLGYARWNKAVGYCQGFNMLAALILQVMEKNESDALKVMIYLIEGVLPEGYFANNLRGLSIDMAVFRDILRVRLQNLSKHLDKLQNESKDLGNSYEPPLTNVFTMQWFLTLFCNCLPQRTVLRVWDLIFLEGSTVLLKTALAMWEALSDRIMTVSSADEFYSIMAVLTREMLEFGLMDANNLINTISTMNELVEVKELRERYMYNINPWVSHMAKRGLRLFYADSDIDDTDSDDDVDSRSGSYGLRYDRRESNQRKDSKTNRTIRRQAPSLESEREKVALDISSLKKQYTKLKERQKQVQVILTAACNGQNIISTANSSAMNHLLFGKTALRCTSVGPIPGSIPLRYVQQPETKKETKHRKRPSYSSSSSSTSTELCDDPALETEPSDSSDCDIKCDENIESNDLCRDKIKADCDVSLSEVLRANSEILNRICKGVVEQPPESINSSLEDRLPDLISDIEVLEETLEEPTVVLEEVTKVKNNTVKSETTDNNNPTQPNPVEIVQNDEKLTLERSESIVDEVVFNNNNMSTIENSDNDILRIKEDVELEILKIPEETTKTIDSDESKFSWNGENNSVIKENDEGCNIPVSTFPSKIRLPKQLSIELGLYPDDTSN
ncbi:TBC1 domain family member 30-like isoform X2 [Daktulosphaira vitifoliae]|uniref:TBC1 domain family member 30-like isoform X2 n=1 Tax=Daktulosphaira vitifoliae TaxID=58002 RepID=UPI0021AA5E7F|nr:TBC1 domain family member 30-like isoform X2 [Daktulosphaira vitifoliae]